MEGERRRRIKSSSLCYTTTSINHVLFAAPPSDGTQSVVCTTLTTCLTCYNFLKHPVNLRPTRYLIVGCMCQVNWLEVSQDLKVIIHCLHRCTNKQLINKSPGTRPILTLSFNNAPPVCFHGYVLLCGVTLNKKGSATPDPVSHVAVPSCLPLVLFLPSVKVHSRRAKLVSVGPCKSVASKTALVTSR